MHMFKELEQKAKENVERWKAIDKLMVQMKEVLSNTNESRTDELVELNSAMILLFAEQLKPMSDDALNSIDVKGTLDTFLSDLNLDGAK